MTERRTREGFAPSRFAIVAALGIGMAIAVVDMLPNWDDTGITAGSREDRRPRPGWTRPAQGSRRAAQYMR